MHGTHAARRFRRFAALLLALLAAWSLPAASAQTTARYFLQTGVYGYHYRGVTSGVRVDLFFTFRG